MLMQYEALTVKVCLYPWITLGKPTFAEFRITTTLLALLTRGKLKTYDNYMLISTSFLDISQRPI